MNAYQPLNCDLHDYLEIACMHGYALQVQLIDDQCFAARALTTRTRNGQEFLVLQRDAAPFEVRLDQLLAITPTDSGASFGRIVLAESHCTSPTLCATELD